MSSHMIPSISVDGSSAGSDYVDTPYPQESVISRMFCELESERDQDNYLNFIKEYGVVVSSEYEEDEHVQLVFHEIISNANIFSAVPRVLRKPLNTLEGVKSFLAQPDLFQITGETCDAQILRSMHMNLHKINKARQVLAKGSSFSRYAQDISKTIIRETSSSGIKPTEIDTKVTIAISVLEQFELYGLMTVHSDWVIGLNPKSIIVRKDQRSPPLNVDLAQYVKNRVEEVIVSVTHSTSAAAWFPWLLFEDDCGRGTLGKGRSQMYTAMRTTMEIITRIHRQALTADSKHCVQRPAEMYQIYGIRALGNIWELDIMLMNNGRYPIITLWTGSVASPAGMAEIGGLLKYINSEHHIRHKVISNWLYCLRDQQADMSQLVSRRTTKAIDRSRPRNSSKDLTKPYARQQSRIASSKSVNEADSSTHDKIKAIQSWLKNVPVTPSPTISDSNQTESIP
ncbi:uncharacterized protein L201_001746 [Kwoniella dendrophila CBS 6074]|uniref:Fungal-type protein kinase domain-containing protein n=1 Tax=Kwoniella dendrophila CBS 6074 TaxID=1295534 RepID=A0AAX4JNB6_9TREE